MIHIPTPAWFTLIPRRTRRALVLTTYLSYTGMLLAWILLEQPLRWVVVPPLGLSIIAMGMLFIPQILGISDGPDAALNERQLAIRNRTYVNAYRVLGGVVVLAAL